MFTWGWGCWFRGPFCSALMKGQGREEDAVPSQRSRAAAWKRIALLFLSPKEMPEKQTLLPDATWTPNVLHRLAPARSAEAPRGGLAVSLSSLLPGDPSAVAAPSVPQAAGRAGQLTGFKRGGQVLGGMGGPFGHP